MGVSLILGATPPEVTGVTPSPAPQPAALATQPAAAAEPPATGWFGANAEEPATTPASPALSQFNAAQTSAHVTISAGGLKARYIGGTKEDEMCGVVFGDGVIPSFDKGQYFEVRVEMARAGDDDGLVIGVTTFDPLTAKEIYEVANMVPDSWSLGYDGSAQIDDEEDMRDISWQPNLLKKGDTVGLLVRSDGLVLYQNGVQVEEVKCGNSPAGKPLYPMIDLLGGTDAVSLNIGASPPA